MSVTPRPLPAAPHGQLPSGTVTFVFTDIEGSTKRWERDRIAMEAALRRHDALLYATLRAHGGHVFKTIGDAFCAAFAQPDAALAAAIEVQRRLANEDFTAVGGLRVRAALHAGTADERDGDYLGPVVNRTARLLAIGSGGQVLLSGAAAVLARGRLPAEAALLDLGEHRLKDLAQPEHVFQLLGPDLPATFPPLRSLGAYRTNLPHALTSFVGREAELTEIGALVAQHRFVTLVGSGGIGKTRCTLQVAADFVEAFSDGVWLIELAPLSSGDYIASAIAQTLGFGLASDGDPVADVVRALGAKRMLLVLDNCEHLVAAAGRVVAELLRGCPQVKILASSRTILGIAGERAYRLPSLAFPAAASAAAIARDAASSAAVALFVERARAVERRFALTADNLPAVVEICRRLDGIPLALELAAARVAILSPRQLRDRLDERFRVLTAGRRDVLPRQQTLRALIDWSYDLLDKRERIVFRRLGIFVNGWTLEGAAAVVAFDGLDELDVFDALAALVDQSLVLAEPAGDDVRYRLLESTRVYAAEKLALAGEREAVAARHVRALRDRFAVLAQRCDASARWGDLDDALAVELEDVRAALDAALAGPDLLVGAELLADVGGAWEHLGLDREGDARIEAFLPALPLDASRLRARLLISLVTIASHIGRTNRAFDAAVQAVAEARRSGDPATLGDALGQFAYCASRRRDFDAALAALREAEAVAPASPTLRLRLLAAQSFVSGECGDFAGAREAADALRREHRALGNASAERIAALNVAEIEHAHGDTARAIAVVRDVLPGFRADRDRLLLVNVLVNLAGYLLAVDDFDSARAAALEAIDELAGRDPGAAYVAVALEVLAAAHALEGRGLEPAASLVGYADAALRAVGFHREFNETTTHERVVRALRAGLDAVRANALLREGGQLAPEAAVARGRALAGADARPADARRSEPLRDEAHRVAAGKTVDDRGVDAEFAAGGRRDADERGDE